MASLICHTFPASPAEPGISQRISLRLPDTALIWNLESGIGAGAPPDPLLQQKAGKICGLGTDNLGISGVPERKKHYFLYKYMKSHARNGNSS